MIFRKSDRETIQNILGESESIRSEFQNLRNELLQLNVNIRRMEHLTQSIWNEIETVKSRMIDLENKIIPKLASPPSSINSSSKMPKKK